jgi:hypothetical protein
MTEIENEIEEVDETQAKTDLCIAIGIIALVAIGTVSLTIMAVAFSLAFCK